MHSTRSSPTADMRPASFITLPYAIERVPPSFEGYEIQYPESLVKHFLTTYTKPGGRVLDPFAGLGTTLFVCEEMSRIPYGVEFDRKRFEWVAGQMEHWQNLRHGDAFRLPSYGFPKLDFVMTSPPYMPRHHKWNPLFEGDPAKAGYDVYLRRMKAIFKRVAVLMKRGAYCVVQADNLRHGQYYTSLVHDIASALSGILNLESEIIVAWENPPRSADRHTHCLLFRKI